MKEYMTDQTIPPLKRKMNFTLLTMVIQKVSTQLEDVNISYTVRMVIHIGKFSRTSKPPFLYNF